MDPITVNLGNYPLKDITAPHPHDVLCGRGGGTNNHVGNSHWRMLVAANKQLYVTLPKRQKMLLSRSIVNAVRSQNPPGRFLQKEAKSDLWYDVGDQRAQEKTSQALREGAPDIRSKISHGDCTDDSTHVHTESTGVASSSTFSSGSQSEPLSSPTAVLAPPVSHTNASMMSPGTPFVPVIVPAMGPPPGSTPVMVYAMPQNGMPGVPMYHAIMTPQGIMVPGTMAPAFPPPVPPQGPNKAKADSSPAPTPSDLMPPPPNQPPSYHSHYQRAVPPPIDAPVLSSEQQLNYDPVPQKADDVGDYEREAAALMNSQLEQAGMSFGSTSMMSVGNQKLEPAGLSFGSMMSYSVANSKLPDMLDGGLEQIGASFGSLSLTSADASTLRDSLFKQSLPGSSATPTLLSQQRSKGNLLDCSDTESEDDDEESSANQASKSAEWEKLKAMLEQHTNTNMDQGQAMYDRPLPPAPQHNHFEAVPQTGFYENISALSMGDFGDHDREFGNISPVQIRQGFDENGDDIPPPLPFSAKQGADDEDAGISERQQLDMLYLAQGRGANF